MKVILSSKGFDSASGGKPGPILPDGTLISLPIPRDRPGSGIPYASIRAVTGDGLKVAHRFPRFSSSVVLGSRARSDTRPRWPSLSGLTTARIACTNPPATSSENTLTTRPAAS
jgi:hypothetical protein